MISAEDEAVELGHRAAEGLGIDVEDVVDAELLAVPAGEIRVADLVF